METLRFREPEEFDHSCVTGKKFSFGFVPVLSVPGCTTQSALWVCGGMGVPTPGLSMPYINKGSLLLTARVWQSLSSGAA